MVSGLLGSPPLLFLGCGGSLCAEDVYARHCSVCCIRCVTLARVDTHVLRLPASSPSHFEYKNTNEPALKESEGSIPARL